MYLYILMEHATKTMGSSEVAAEKFLSNSNHTVISARAANGALPKMF